MGVLFPINLSKEWDDLIAGYRDAYMAKPSNINFQNYALAIRQGTGAFGKPDAYFDDQDGDFKLPVQQRCG